MPHANNECPRAHNNYNLQDKLRQFFNLLQSFWRPHIIILIQFAHGYFGSQYDRLQNI